MPQHDAIGESRRVKKKCKHKSKRKPSGDRVEAIGTALVNKVARQRRRTVLYRNKLLLKNPLPLGMGSVKARQEGGEKAGDGVNEITKKTLEKQLTLLSKRSEEVSGHDELWNLTDAMAKVAMVLEGQQSQSFYEASTCHPYVVQLPVEDLVQLYAARYKAAHGPYPEDFQ